MIYVYATMLTLLNMVFWVSIIVNLPGTWLMVLVPSWSSGGNQVPSCIAVRPCCSWPGTCRAGRGDRVCPGGSRVAPRGGIAPWRGIGDHWQHHRRHSGYNATGADCGHSHRRLPRSLRRLRDGGFMGRSAAVSKRQSGSGSGRGPVLGDDIEASGRRRHCGGPGAGRFLLNGVYGRSTTPIHSY